MTLSVRGLGILCIWLSIDNRENERTTRIVVLLAPKSSKAPIERNHKMLDGMREVFRLEAITSYMWLP